MLSILLLNPGICAETKATNGGRSAGPIWPRGLAEPVWWLSLDQQAERLRETEPHKTTLGVSECSRGSEKPNPA